MLKEKKPINEINDFLAKVKTICDAKESYGRDIGTQLHEWIDLFLKGEKPVLPSDQPLKRMAEKFTDFWKKHKFNIVLVASLVFIFLFWIVNLLMKNTILVLRNLFVN